MAFFNKIGNILKNTAGKHINSGSSSVSRPFLLQAIRCSTSKLFIGGLSYNTDEPSLKEVFEQYGDVLDARLIVDRETGRSRGFGFVTYHTREEASSAVQALDGQALHGRVVQVKHAVDKALRGGDGYGGGGYGATGYGPSGGALHSNDGYGTADYGSSGESFASGY